MNKYFLLLSFLICTQQYASATDKQLSANEVTALQTRCVGLSQLQPYVSQHELEKMAQLRFPDEFEGAEVLDLNLVRSYRQTQAQFKGAVREVGYVQHDVALKPLAANIRNAFVEFAGMPQYSSVAKRFLAEMNYHAEIEDVNPEWVVSLPLRFAAAIGKHTADQKALFSHVPFPSYFFGMIENEAWKTESATVKSVDEYNNKGFELPDDDECTSSHFYGAVVDQISDQVKRALPAVATYPIMNKAKFGISFMVRSNLNDIFPIAFPFHEREQKSKKLIAHGIKMSTFAFGTHDALHKLADARRYEFFQHIFYRGERYVKAGGNAWKFAEVYTPVAVQKYGMVMGLFNRIYDAMVGKLLPYRGIEEYRAAMAGFFWIDHEEPYMPREIYDYNDVDEIIAIAASQDGMNSGSYSMGPIDSWNDSYDPLNTSPLDGSSQLDDEAIFTFVETALTLGHSNGYKYHDPYFFTMKVSDQLDKIVGKKVLRGKRFIDAIYRSKNGQEYVFSFPTLFHKWLNADDNLGILSYGGTHITKPDLTMVDDPRAEAIETLEYIEEAIDDHVEHFVDVATFFVNQGGENSLAQQYFRQHFALEQRVKAQLSK
jgi:hypothetical protein